MNPPAISFPNPTMLHRGGGEYIVSPGKPKTRVSVAEAARELRTSTETVYRLIKSKLLASKRPSPRGIYIEAAVLMKYREDCRDPEYWNAERLAAFRAACQRKPKPAAKKPRAGARS